MPMKKIILILLLFVSIKIDAQNTLNIVPMPAEITMGKEFYITKKPEIRYSKMDGVVDDGYYELEVTANGINIWSKTAAGRFYAMKTLEQLGTLNDKKQAIFPQCKIKDYPRFKYRGMHLDVSRHFFPVTFIKK